MEPATGMRAHDYGWPALQVISSVVSKREVREDIGLETFTRTNTVTSDVPWLIRKATGLEDMVLHTETVIDRAKRHMSLSTKHQTRGPPH